jgi:Ras GTPase-activating-like protein IQGAP1
LSIKSIQFILSPCDIYKNWINKIESDTGKPSGHPYDVTNQKALEHEEVRRQLEENIKSVKTYTTKFLQLILKSIDKIP